MSEPARLVRPSDRRVGRGRPACPLGLAGTIGSATWLDGSGDEAGRSRQYSPTWLSVGGRPASWLVVWAWAGATAVMAARMAATVRARASLDQDAS